MMLLKHGIFKNILYIFPYKIQTLCYKVTSNFSDSFLRQPLSVTNFIIQELHCYILKLKN